MDIFVLDLLILSFKGNIINFYKAYFLCNKNLPENFPFYHEAFFPTKVWILFHYNAIFKDGILYWRHCSQRHVFLNLVKKDLMLLLLMLILILLLTIQVPGFWIWQVSEYARITQGSNYNTISLNRSEFMIIDRVLNMSHTIHSASSLYKLMSTYWEMGAFRTLQKA